MARIPPLFLHWRQHERTGNTNQYQEGQILLSSLCSSLTYREIISLLRAPIALFVWEEQRHQTLRSLEGFTHGLALGRDPGTWLLLNKIGVNYMRLLVL